MKDTFRNIFLLFGIAAIVIMVCTFDMDFQELWDNISRAGYWFFAVVGIWLVIYFFNALSWFYIIRGGEKKSPISFWRVFKLSISGFALNYATPFGLMGGEPYRIMELQPYVGGPRATSSVILYVMMHIFSHICFWLASIVLYVCLYHVSLFMIIFLTLTTFVLLLLVYFFMRGYKYGMVVKTVRILQHIPFIKKWITKLYSQHEEDFHKIDLQIAQLHNQRKSTFYTSFLFEFTARFLTSAEIFFILKILTPDVNFIDCILIMAFTSLFSNIFFFSPMQLGAREGGFAIAVSELCLTSASGFYTSLITRIRELIWIIIGVGLMKVLNQRPTEQKALKKIKPVKGLLFDYGGTLDSNGRHWANVIWEGYQKANVPITQEQFREAYVYAERYLAKEPVIQPTDTFLDLLRKKIQIELDYLHVDAMASKTNELTEAIAQYCYQKAKEETNQSKKVLDRLKDKYPMVLVTNFYGNMHSVLQDFGMLHYFDSIVESAVVGVRKPSSDIWKLGIEALHMQADEVCAIGDSYEKDIVPAHELGCQTIWLKGEEWKPSPKDESLPSAIITNIQEL